MAYLKLLGPIAGALLLGTLLWLAQDRFKQKSVADKARACAVAAGDKAGVAPLVDCLPAVAVGIATARQAQVCDAALVMQPRATQLYAIRAACSTAINTEVARLAASEGNLADARATIETMQATTIAAVERAEARATNLNLQRKKADDAIDHAPRRADGVVICDAQCLRALAGS